jgi:hypothetical protein
MLPPKIGAQSQPDGLGQPTTAFLPANCKFPKRNQAFQELGEFLPGLLSEFLRFALGAAGHYPEDQGESGATVGRFL